MLKILLLATLLGVAFTQEHRRCVAPPYFQARLLAYDHLTNYYRSGEFFYDAFGERVRVIEKVAENETRPAQDILVLHRERKEFTVDLHTGKCTTTVPKREFRRIEVDEGYHFAEHLGIGSVPTDGLELDVWYRYDNSSDVEGVSVVEFTAKDCIPFYESFEGMMNKEKVHYRREFYNVVTQVVDPNVFDIPKACIER